jgi:ribosomal protein S19
MGEANNILKKMNKSTRFEVHNDKSLSKVKILEVEEGLSRVLSENDFTRRFKHFKRKEKEQ